MTPPADFRTEHGFRHRWMEAVLYLASVMKVPSKELKEPGPIVLYDAQLRLLHEIDEGLAEGQHFFTILKSRQLGVSTIMLLMDIMWLWLYPGLQGAIIGDDENTVIGFRDTIDMMLQSAPPKFRIPFKRNNKKALILGNGSRIQYLIAGKRKNPDLGRSKGFNFVHASEVSGYGDQDGIKSLVDALATENPNRLYIFESTAKGFNAFYDMWLDCLSDPTKRAVFIGWWAKHLNSVPERLVINGMDAGPHPKFERFWTLRPVLDEKERAMAYLLEQDYGVVLSPGQWAWWRDQLNQRSEQNLLQEHPWHADVAFQVTGSAFFNGATITNDMRAIRNPQAPVTFNGYRYRTTSKYFETVCEAVSNLEEAELKVWEPPMKGARYAVGVDVAHGRNPNSDRHCIEIFRCYADKIVQVAEWATNMPETRVVAWVMAHLCSNYRDCMVNLEVNGPGLQVMNELNTLRQDLQNAGLHGFEALIAEDGKPVFDHKHALENMRWYLYHRPDTPAGGYMYNFKTNQDNKQEIMNGLRDSYSTDQLVLRGLDVLDEMKDLIQNGLSIGARPGKRDDRVFSAALAVHAWKQWIRTPMLAERRLFVVEQRKDQMLLSAQGRVQDTIVAQHFKRMAAERQAARLDQLLNGR